MKISFHFPSCFRLRHRIQRRLVVALALVSFVTVLMSGAYTPAREPATEILWDTYGVPHIYGNTSQSVFHAFGWAQMHSHGDRLLRLYGEARGRAAEYWGEEYLEADRWVRTMGIPQRSQSWYQAQNPLFRQYLDAFAAGINAYADAHPEQLSNDVKVVLPVTAVDVLAHSQRLLNFTFVVNPGRIANLSETNETHASTSASSSTAWLTSLCGNQQTQSFCVGFDATHTSALGSNAWAIAPSRSASGNAMLLANPHLPWSDPFFWYEAQLVGPGIDAYGATLVGIPVLAIAFNDSLGWTHTINTYDGWDAYELTLTEGGYRFDNEVRAFETEEQLLKVKQADGTLKTISLTVQHSIHGPVVEQTDGTAIALRVAGLDHPYALTQWWNMSRASNLEEFEAALQDVQIPMFTIMYADRVGHILHLFNGQVPIRSEGDFAAWSTLIPGDTSTTLWTETHPYTDLPLVLDPPNGWLQNANDPPWTTTIPQILSPNKYPTYLAPPGPMSLRAQQSAQMLKDDPLITFEELEQYKHSTEMELANRLLPDLFTAAQPQAGSLLQQAVEVLAQWDRRTDAESRGAVLFAAWMDEVDLDEDELFAVSWDAAEPLATPRELTHMAEAVAALERAAAQMQQTYGQLDIAWGDVFRLESGDRNLPANGGSDDLGIFRTLWFEQNEDKTFTAVGGDSFVALVEFSSPIQARVLTAYGNSSQPNLNHSGDQLELFARQTLRPVWRSRTEIQAHLETIEGSGI
jgi:acyl-homoserine-lactone acylase